MSAEFHVVVFFLFLSVVQMMTWMNSWESYPKTPTASDVTLHQRTSCTDCLRWLRFLFFLSLLTVKMLAFVFLISPLFKDHKRTENVYMSSSVLDIRSIHATENSLELICCYCVIAVRHWRLMCCKKQSLEANSCSSINYKALKISDLFISAWLLIFSPRL